MKTKLNDSKKDYYSDDLSIEKTYKHATIDDNEGDQEKLADWFKNQLDLIEDLSA